MSVQAPVEPSPDTSHAVDTRPTVLITEQEVKLLTAAAIAAPTLPKRGLFSRWIAANRAARAARPQRHYTPHYEFLEHAAMARAMERL